MPGIYFDLIMNNFGPVIEQFTMLDMSQAYVQVKNRLAEHYYVTNPPTNKKGEIISLTYPYRRKQKKTS